MASRQKLNSCPKQAGQACDTRIWQRIQRRHDPRRVFVNIPFTDDYRDLGTHLVIALTCLNLRPVTARDERRSAEPRICKICEVMQTTNYCVSDLTLWRPNVALEIGLALAVGCHTVVFASDRHEVVRELSDYNAFDAIDHRHDWKVMVRKLAEWVRSDVKEITLSEERYESLIDTVGALAAMMKSVSAVPTHEQVLDALGKATAVAGPPPTSASVYVPAGVFPDESGKEWKATGAFHIDRFPVTNADYETYLRAVPTAVSPSHWVGASPPEAIRDHPVVCVTFDEADKYAQWAGKRLPTADEWEKAAGGPEGWLYPWGDEFQVAACNCGRRQSGTTPVDSYPSGVSGYGIWDMAGNVWEWTQTSAGGGGRVIKGASWINNPEAAATFYRTKSSEDRREDNIGFRCVQDAVARPLGRRSP